MVFVPCLRQEMRLEPPRLAYELTFAFLKMSRRSKTNISQKPLFWTFLITSPTFHRALSGVLWQLGCLNCHAPIWWHFDMLRPYPQAALVLDRGYGYTAYDIVKNVASKVAR